MEEQQTTTVAEILSGPILTAIDIMEDTDVNSEEYKSARQTVEKFVDLINQSDKIGKDYDAKITEVTKEPEKKKFFDKDLVIDILKIGAEIAIPIVTAIITYKTTMEKQQRTQAYLDDQLRKTFWFEERGTVRSYPGKMTYKLLEAQSRDI